MKWFGVQEQNQKIENSNGGISHDNTVSDMGVINSEKEKMPLAVF